MQVMQFLQRHPNILATYVANCRANQAAPNPNNERAAMSAGAPQGAFDVIKVAALHDSSGMHPLQVTMAQAEDDVATVAAIEHQQTLLAQVKIYIDVVMHVLSLSLFLMFTFVCISRDHCFIMILQVGFDKTVNRNTEEGGSSGGGSGTTGGSGAMVVDRPAVPKVPVELQLAVCQQLSAIVTKHSGGEKGYVLSSETIAMAMTSAFAVALSKVHVGDIL